MEAYKVYEGKAAKDLSFNFDESPPEKVYVYYAYRGGVVKEFSNKREASDFSANMERKELPSSIDASNLYWNRRKEVSNLAHLNWFKDLELVFDEVPKAVFTICYNAAYDRGHSNGYDAVAEILEDYISMAKECNSVWRDL
jgi:hypothetical protein